MNNYTPNPVMYPTRPIPPAKPKYVFSRGEFWLALALWFVGYSYVSTIPVGSHPLPALAVQVLLLVGTFVYLTRPSCGGRATPWSCILVAVNVAMCASFLWSVNRVILALVTVWNAFSWFYLVLALTGNSRERVPGKHFLRELFSSLSLPFRAPVTGFAALFAPKRTSDEGARSKSRLRKGLGWGCLGLVMAGIPTAIIIGLLSFDDAFVRIIRRIIDAILSVISWRTILRQINNIGFGLLVGVLFFGTFLTCKTLMKRARARDGEVVSPPAPGTVPPADAGGIPRRDGAHIAPVVLMAALLTPILAVYVLFFISQWDYYISAFSGVRPEELTYAAYAREGFFQLLVVALINVGLSFGAALLSRRRAYDPDRPRRDRTHPVIRIYLAVLALMTLVLIATAISKMILYVDTYGMTHRRIYATWFMLLLAVSFVIFLVRQVWTRLNLTGSLVAAALAFFLVLSLVPVDSLIVRYNVNAALDGNLRTMQGSVCRDSDTAGVLPALDFMEGTAPDAVDPAKYDADQLQYVRDYTDRYLYRMANQLREMDWHEHNITTLRAKSALERAGYMTNKEDSAS